MIALYQKRNFLKHFLKKYKSGSTLTKFLNVMYYNNELLEQVTFSRNILTHYKYCISINADKKHMMIRINNRYYKEEKMIKYILRALDENKERQINICIVSNKKGLNHLLDNVCHSLELVQQTLKDIVIDNVIKEAEKMRLKNRIDKALDEKNEIEFQLLVKQYKELL